VKWLITGAGSGIGAAVARRAAGVPGAGIGLVDRDGDALGRVAAEVRALGALAVPVVADLAAPEAPSAVVAEVAAALGGLDTLVSNAGATGRGTLREVSLEEWQVTFDLNVRATWLLARAAYDALEAAHGSVVVTTSISALHPTPRAGAYSVSKAALSMLVRHLALEWGPAGVRVNAVAPGPTHSPMTFRSFGDPADPAARARRARRESATPLSRLAESDDIADVVLFLAGPGARHLTGVEVPVNGGLDLTLMPGAREQHH
jgi:NAD(P)-dependent dehydrogenase (short-subunit alcohol dehydrogenase family)